MFGFIMLHQDYRLATDDLNGPCHGSVIQLLASYCRGLGSIVVHEVALGQVFLQVIWSFLVTIIPFMLNAGLLLYHLWCVILAIYRTVKQCSQKNNEIDLYNLRTEQMGF
jgi:hypothetical protein